MKYAYVLVPVKVQINRLDNIVEFQPTSMSAVRRAQAAVNQEGRYETEGDAHWAMTALMHIGERK